MTEAPLKATIIPVTPLQQNCTLLWCTATSRAAVIDPGGDLPKIEAAIAQAGVTVEKILVTHGHADHCGEAGTLAKRLGVPIEGPHEADRYWLARLEDDCRKWGLRGEAFEPDRWLDDGEQVTVGDLTLDVYLCPGHTPGHVVFHHPPSRLAVVGDVIFQGSVGRTDFPMSDPDALIEAIVTKLWPLGDDTVFLPGHGGVSSFGRERAHNPFVGDAALAGR
ncbi:MBL fold metallo-hydrolase [Sphingomonas sp.]|uniref:MBL fold metallo-hydrolase n=1 Tax=Sphingomonas sp. TaxID=28214 RepID=UPI002DD636F8|nr:MBL fold metallo-hydrolase [Sphingomonas sp.]